MTAWARCCTACMLHRLCSASIWANHSLPVRFLPLQELGKANPAMLEAINTNQVPRHSWRREVVSADGSGVLCG